MGFLVLTTSIVQEQGGGGDEEFLVCDLTVSTASRTDVNNGLAGVSAGDTVCVPPG